MDENLFRFRCHCKTAKLKQERHNTVHGACQTDNFVVSFPVAPLCGSVFLGFASFSVAILIMTHKMSSCMLLS